MAAPIDITNERYGRLVVLRFMGKDPRDSRHRVWECLCDCGTIIVTRQNSLRSGNTKSCTCLQKDTCREREFKHGMVGTPEYKTWTHMKGRCFNPNDQDFYSYGERGITICERWMDFALFYADMGPRPSPNHTIERKENNGNYEPSNCIWIPRSEQPKNRRPSSEWRRAKDGRSWGGPAWCG